MRINRKTAVALAASATLVVGSGVVASAAVFGLPVLGFGTEPTGSAASPASATTPPVSVVDQTVYDDHYVTSPGSGGTTGATRAPSPGAPLPVAAQAVSQAASPATGGVPPAPPTAATTPPSTAGSIVTTTTRPAPPPGCLEPEWDPEHRAWHCKGD